jgi:alkylated DNA repair dioxygenase AlkB
MNNEKITITTGYEELSKDIAIYRGFLTLAEQLEIIQEIPYHFELFDKNGNYNYPDNRGNLKGRCFRKIEDCGPSINKKTKEMKRIMEEKNEIFTYPDFTHVLLNTYPSTVGMGWHRDDIGSHDGDESAPVYSLSIGNSGIFIYKTHDKDCEHIVTLNSGDLLVFGGKMRRMPHCLKEVIPFSFDNNHNVRHNLTFRTCNQLTEEQYNNAQTDAYNIRRKEEFTKPRAERRRLNKK